jgi:hypothetical protein
MYATGMKILGRFGEVMILSQENCLYNNHRLTCERWGGDYLGSLFRKLITVCILLKIAMLNGFLR